MPVEGNPLKNLHIWAHWMCFFEICLFRKFPLRRLSHRFSVVAIYSRFVNSYKAIELCYLCWKFRSFGEMLTIFSSTKHWILSLCMTCRKFLFFQQPTIIRHKLFACFYFYYWRSCLYAQIIGDVSSAILVQIVSLINSWLYIINILNTSSYFITCLMQISGELSNLTFRHINKLITHWSLICSSACQTTC